MASFFQSFLRSNQRVARSVRFHGQSSDPMLSEVRIEMILSQFGQNVRSWFCTSVPHAGRTQNDLGPHVARGDGALFFFHRLRTPRAPIDP